MSSGGFAPPPKNRKDNPLRNSDSNGDKRANKILHVRPFGNAPSRQDASSIKSTKPKSSTIRLSAWNKQFGGNDNDHIGTVVSIETPINKVCRVR